MLKTDQKFGKYRIISVLGAGGMGEVYLAEDTLLKRKVALKILTLKDSDNEDYRQRFMREARVISALNHPNIVVIYEISELEDNHFIAMEFVEGKSIRQLIKNNELSLRNAVDIGIQTASALAAAHAAGIIHRDIKPDNIVRRNNNIVKVLDFGLAKQTNQLSDQDSADPEAPTQAHQLTIPGMIMGTVAYMSPEQARGTETDERTDIWSLGVVLYEMITGNLPFAEKTTSDMLAAILKTEASPLSLYVPEVSPEIDNIVKKALSKDLEKRYGTARELMLDLEDFKNELTVSIHPLRAANKNTDSFKKAEVTNISLKPEKNSNIFRLLWFALPALVLLIGFSVWYFNRKPRLPEINPASLASSQVVSWKSDLGGDSSNRARFSPDGKLVAYVATQNGKNSIWLKQIGGGEPFTRKQDDAEDKSPIWSPDGSSIAYFSTRGGQRGIWMIPAFGGSPMLFSTIEGDGRLIMWSKDGTIYFEMKQNLYALMIESKQIMKLTNFDETKPVNRGLSVSPDELQIVYADRKDGHKDLWTADLHGTNPVQLTSDEYDDDNPVWYPDEQRIIYNSSRNGIKQLCMIYLDGRPNTQFTFNDNDSIISDISADGTKILYKSSKDDSDLWGVKVSDKAEFQITSDIGAEFWQSSAPNGEDLVYQSAAWTSVGDKPYNSSIMVRKIKSDGQKSILSPNGFDPHYSPDGNYIAYLNNDNGKQNLWITSALGGDEHQLTSEGIWVSGFSQLPYNHLQTQDFQWSPDSRFLIYSANREGVSNIWQAAVDDSGEKRLTNNEDKNLRFSDPIFSPDGSFFACSGLYTDEQNKRHWNIWLSTDGKFDQIYQADSVLQIIGWSAFADELIVKTVKNGNEMQALPTNADILQISLKDKQPNLITSLKEVYFSNIKLSPDRETIAFVTRQNEGDSIQILPSTGGTAKTLISGKDARVYFSNLTFAPDGKTIYYGKQANWQVISMISNFR